MQKTNPQSIRRGVGLAGFLIGLAVAGFLDGILLHQVLQWHSLLSSLDGQIYQDLRFRMLTDGLFHAAMYIVGLVGLLLLWRARYEFASLGSGKRFASVLLVGFGVWHLIDAVVNHWLLGLHHIKEGSPNWLAFDLAFFLLGLACVALGVYLHRSGGTGTGGLSKAAAACVSATAVATGVISASPWSGSSSVTVVFSQGVAPSAVFAAVDNANGRILWSNPDGDVWMIDVESSFGAWGFYLDGALYVSGTVLGTGCFSAASVPSA
jgi:uncharacterized membrane protein